MSLTLPDDEIRPQLLELAQRVPDPESQAYCEDAANRARDAEDTQALAETWDREHPAGEGGQP